MHKCLAGFDFQVKQGGLYVVHAAEVNYNRRDRVFD